MSPSKASLSKMLRCRSDSCRELDPDRIGSGIQFGDGNAKSSTTLHHKTLRSSRHVGKSALQQRCQCS
uniref:Uncharacterized protein n=1 Tax=Romanomermis culicivorax TaxID=13658 RepID=A0A915I280_ROMCU